MPRIKTELLQEGMTVANGVKNIDGMLLIPAGTGLSERHIGILQAWGVSEVEVQTQDGTDDSGDPLAKLSPEVVAQITADVKKVFSELDESNPVAMEIFKLMVQRKARKRTA